MFPSTTINGPEPAEMVPAPLIRMEEPLVGSPEPVETTTPAARPCNRLERLLEVTSLSSSPDTVETELDKYLAFLAE